MKGDACTFIEDDWHYSEKLTKARLEHHDKRYLPWKYLMAAGLDQCTIRELFLSRDKLTSLALKELLL